MSSATASGAIIGGTFAFIAFSIISAVGIFFMRRMSKFTKDEVRAGPAAMGRQRQLGRPRLRPTLAVPVSRCARWWLQAQIACISNIVAWFCMWLMWLCTWLHQWHPVIRECAHAPVHAPGNLRCAPATRVAHRTDDLLQGRHTSPRR